MTALGPIVLDVDGTIVGAGERTMSPTMFAAIGHAQAAGRLVVFATSRSPQTMLGLTVPMPSAASCSICNGAAEISLTTGELRDTITLTPAEVETLLGRVKSENWVGRIEVTTCEGPHPTSATATRKVPSSEAIGRHALKVVVSVKPNGNELMANLVRTSAELQHLSGVQSESGRWEFTAAGATKLAGVERIINRYGYSGDDCIAFGNSFNDEQVLAWAGRSIGVEPIPETVRAVVDKTVSTIDEVAQHLLI